MTLINEILEMSKIEAGHVTYTPTTFNMPVIIQDLCSMFDLRLSAKNLKITIDIAPEIPEYIISDENKFKEILINLLGNAVKFTSKGGLTLRCHVEMDPRFPDPKNLLLFIDIEDTGVGILPEEMPSLFKPFEQTRSGSKIFGGTGLGLAISQSHAKLLGGEITVTSTPDVGSCFHVKLAVQKGERLESNPEGVSRQVIGIKPGTQEIRVLIVDDNQENRLVLQEILEPLGIRTLGAENGKIALETALSWKPDLILMDLRMPVMSGFESARRIKSTEHGQNIHIVAVTASILELDQNNVTESGMTGYLRKPFKENDLFALLESKLGPIFIYSDPVNTVNQDVEISTIILTPEAMTVIPEEIIEEMLIATTNANIDGLVAGIDRVAAFSPQIADKLRNMADNYQYDSLLNLFKKAGEDGAK